MILNIFHPDRMVILLRRISYTFLKVVHENLILFIQVQGETS